MANIQVKIKTDAQENGSMSVDIDTRVMVVSVLTYLKRPLPSQRHSSTEFKLLTYQTFTAVTYWGAGF